MARCVAVLVARALTTARPGCAVQQVMLVTPSRDRLEFAKHVLHTYLDPLKVRARPASRPSALPRS